MTPNFDEQFAAIFADEDFKVDVRPAEKRTREMMKLVQVTSQRSSERQAQEKQQQQRREREKNSLNREAAADPSAEADPQAQQEQLEEIQRQVDEALTEVDELGDEPETFMNVVRAPQALPQVKLDHLPLLQQTLNTCQLVTDNNPSTSNNSALEAAFTWLLRGSCDQLLVCPDADLARATFQAVCFGGRELATAAYHRFLGWCGMSEVQRGYPSKDVTEQPWVSELDSSKPGLTGILCRSEQQQQPTAQWLPSAEDFVKALTALGCNAAAAAGSGTNGSSRRSSAAAATPATPAANLQQQGPAAAVTNLKLLLQMLTHLCRLQSTESGRLPYSLGDGVQGAAACKQLAHLLMYLMLDRQLAEANCGCLLASALSALIAAIGESEWARVEKQLLDELSRGIGPSNRSLLHVLSQLPLSARGASLKQQAALQLIRRVTAVGKRPTSAAAQAKGFSSARDVQRELVKLLGQTPSRALISHLTVSDKDGKQQQDTWALLDLLEAAHMVLWTDMVRTDNGVADDIIKWFIKWTEALERTLLQKVQSHRVRNTLTELANAYRFWNGSGLSTMDLNGDDDMNE